MLYFGAGCRLKSTEHRHGNPVEWQSGGDDAGDASLIPILSGVSGEGNRERTLSPLQAQACLNGAV